MYSLVRSINRSVAGVGLPAVAAFSVYTCMYAFRKPFTVADYGALTFAGIDYKIWLVIAQTVGYTISKFAGIRIVAGLQTRTRARGIIGLIFTGWAALFCFAFIPAPWNILCLLLNGIPLGMVYGLVFSYLEGRKNTELLGAVLACSFIFASGFAQNTGKWLLTLQGVSVWWMPFLTGLLFFPPLIFFTWLLDKTPSPTKADMESRTIRQPMNKNDRRKFIKTFLPGLLLLIVTYVLLTVVRDYRSNFAAEIWKETGFGKNAAVFSQSEIPASLVVLLLMGLLAFVRSSIQAFFINHLLIVTGLLLALGCTFLFTEGRLPVFWWMTLTGVGLYMGYVPFNCMLFERLIAAFRYVSNAGFIIYVADSFGYLGSNLILLMKNFMHIEISWTGFFIKMILISGIAGILLIILSAAYFSKKYKNYYSRTLTSHRYA